MSAIFKGLAKIGGKGAKGAKKGAKGAKAAKKGAKGAKGAKKGAKGAKKGAKGAKGKKKLSKKMNEAQDMIEDHIESDSEYDDSEYDDSEYDDSEEDLDQDDQDQEVSTSRSASTGYVTRSGCTCNCPVNQSGGDMLASLTVKELRQIASDLKIPGRSSMNKVQLIAAIR